MSKKQIFEEMEHINVHHKGIEIMTPKSRFFVLKLEKVPIKEAIILKQEALSCDCDCALAWNVITLGVSETDALLFCTEKQLNILIEKLKFQPFTCKKMAIEIEETIKNFNTDEFSIMLKSAPPISVPPRRIMGILNVTPDSFADGGLYLNIDKAIKRAIEIEHEGADILDLGAESTRPYATPVSVEEELNRIVPVLTAIRDEVKIPISIDTYKWQVAEKCLRLGANMINDVTGLKDENMIKIVKEYDAGVVIMHMQGTPQTMQNAPYYTDVIAEISKFLRARTTLAISKGIDKKHIIIDPGIGFGKTLTHNIQILEHLHTFKSLGFPVLIGTSRKGFIGKILNVPVTERMIGSVTTALIALHNGASILRVHDVKETKQMIQIFEAVYNDDKKI